MTGKAQTGEHGGANHWSGKRPTVLDITHLNDISNNEAGEMSNTLLR